MLLIKVKILNVENQHLTNLAIKLILKISCEETAKLLEEVISSLA